MRNSPLNPSAPALLLLSLLQLTPSQARAQQVQFVDSPPLASTVTSPVQDCAGSGTVNVPIITWGGDIATIHGNGGDKETASGSIFGREGLKLKLFREDSFPNQLKDFLACKSPYLRGTLGMMHMASEVAARDPRTRLTIIHQMTWSAGGDALVVKSGIKSPAQLRGKTIALQAYGPHVDYLGKILADAGMSLKDVKIRWTKDLTGTKQTPTNAFYQNDIDAVLVITPDALKLTSNGTVGTGAEDSVKGARILLSTKTASRVIGDVYAVREDYLKTNREDVTRFVHGLLSSQEELVALVKAKSQKKGEYTKTMTAAAKILLDSEQALPDAEGLFGDASFVLWGGNVKFFNDTKNPRNLQSLNREIGEAVAAAGLVKKGATLSGPDWSFDSLKKDLKNATMTEQSRFDANQVAQVATKITTATGKEGKAEGELFSFEITFKPNQNTFSESEYQDAFKRAINLAATYGGAVITIEGHSDPLGYLKKKKDGEAQVVLTRIRQSGKNLSMTRAMGVRDSLLRFAKARGINIDANQFAVVGHGIDKPKNGLCGSEPCAPANEKEWLANMRVEFRILQVEAEQAVFESL